MENEHPSIFDLIVENHIGLERQGPGGPEMTIKALSFLDNLNKISRVADLACGTGGQTMVLAHYLKNAGQIIILFREKQQRNHFWKNMPEIKP